MQVLYNKEESVESGKRVLKLTILEDVFEADQILYVFRKVTIPYPEKTIEEILPEP